MDRRRDPRYKHHSESHHYDDRYNATYDNYDYDEDYGNQYANTGHHHPHPHPHAHHPHHADEQHGYEDDEEHWASQQHDFYDTVPATNVPPPPVKQPVKNVARVQICGESDNSNIPQAPPPPRFGPSGGYASNNNNNDRKAQKYGNLVTTDQKSRRESEVHIRFDPGAKRDFPQKQQSFIDGFRNGGEVQKKKEVPGGQPANSIRSIINNLKSGGGAEKQEESPPRNRVSTNPFMRANQHPQNQVPSQNQNRYEPKNPSKNVAEVVEKMNNGDWPIQIDDEEAPPIVPSSAGHDPKRNYQAHPDKARQWETLHRKKDEKRSILEDVPHQNAPQAPPLPTQQPPAQKTIQKQASREENDKMSEKSSQEEEHTSVSTDSALCSESSDARGPSPYKLPFDSSQKPIDCAEEAEKLLFYFKAHKEVLDYLGIGLTDRLWKHVQKLPNFEATIRVFKKHEETSKPPPAPPLVQNAAIAPIQTANVPPAPKITISQSFGQQDRKSPIGHSRGGGGGVSQNEQMSPPGFQSPEENRFTKNSDQGNNRERNGNGGGRFVKKSAAALIAKKQGMQIEDPNSATEIIDPRIAEEIKNLRDREEELKRSRSELALVTSPPPSSYQMSPKKSPPNMMRSAQSFDHLDNPMAAQSVRSPIERSHSSHNVYHMKGGGAPVGDSSPYHQTNVFGAPNYGSMPRQNNRKDGAYHPQMRDQHRMHENNNYRQSRNGDFFRAPSSAAEAQNAGWQKSAPPFEAKHSSSGGGGGVHSGLQLPAAGVSLSSYQQRPGDKYQSAGGGKCGYKDRKIGL